MSYHQRQRGYLPGPLPGPTNTGLGGLWEWLFPAPATAVSLTAESTKVREEPREKGAWGQAIDYLEYGAPPPPTPAQAPAPEGAKPEVAPELPGPSFLQRYKGPLIAAGLLAGYFVWKGRKKR